jgi:hypothetical protein
LILETAAGALVRATGWHITELLQTEIGSGSAAETLEMPQ